MAVAGAAVGAPVEDFSDRLSQDHNNVLSICQRVKGFDPLRGRILQYRVLTCHLTIDRSSPWQASWQQARLRLQTEELFLEEIGQYALKHCDLREVKPSGPVFKARLPLRFLENRVRVLPGLCVYKNNELLSQNRREYETAPLELWIERQASVAVDFMEHREFIYGRHYFEQGMLMGQDLRAIFMFAHVMKLRAGIARRCILDS